MKKFALIGGDVSLSPSPEIHNFIAKNMGRAISYDKFSVKSDDFVGRINSLLAAYDGLNVTIPYKIEVTRHLNFLHGGAEIFGSVNTVNCSDKSGYNTDGAGFWLMLKNESVDVKDKDVLVLGAGGAGRSVAKELCGAGARVKIYDIKMQAALSLAQKIQGVEVLQNISAERYRLIVNATGVGMHKSVGICPIECNILANCDTACDLIYEPEKSEFLRIAESFGKRIINGYAMLFYQAYYSQCIWFEEEADADEAKRLFDKYRASKEII